MRFCHELVDVMLRSTSLAEQEKAAAALAALPMTPRAWRAFVSALPALAEVIRQPNSSAAAMREHALGVLLPHIAQFVHADQDQVKEVTAVVISSIVQLLQQSSVVVQCAAACVLRELSLHPGNLAGMMAAGATGQLVRTLNSAQADFLQAGVAAALANIFSHAVNGAECIAAAGAVPSLVKLLGPGSREAAKMSAIIVLAGICSIEAHLPSVTAAGAAAPLVVLIKSRSAEIQREAAVVTALLAADEGSLLPLFAAGAVGAVVPLLRHSSPLLQQTALVVLGNLSGSVDASRAALISAGAVPRLVEMLHSDCEDSQCKAGEASQTSCATSPGTRSSSPQPEPSPPWSSCWPPALKPLRFQQLLPWAISLSTSASKRCLFQPAPSPLLSDCCNPRARRFKSGQPGCCLGFVSRTTHRPGPSLLPVASHLWSVCSNLM